MSSCSATITPTSINVSMGQIEFGKGETCLKAVLGSCLAVAIYHPRTQIAAMAHVVLPSNSGRGGTVGKFAETAVPALVEVLARHGARIGSLKAKIAGGACMFGKGGPIQIGDSNVKAVTRALDAMQIPVLAKDIGGTSGRRVTFCCSTGRMRIERVGLPARTI
jgi:chemotaxis protein CheD